MPGANFWPVRYGESKDNPDSNYEKETTITRRFTDLVHEDTDSDYGVSFPDLLGCTTAGRTLENAREMAVDAPWPSSQRKVSSGMKIPKPSSVDALVAHPDACDAIALILVEALPEHTRVSVSR